MRVIQEKEIHPSTPENNEYNLVEGREERKRTHASTVENDGYNLIEDREERRRTCIYRGER